MCDYAAADCVFLLCPRHNGHCPHSHLNWSVFRTNHLNTKYEQVPFTEHETTICSILFFVGCANRLVHIPTICWVFVWGPRVLLVVCVARLDWLKRIVWAAATVLCPVPMNHLFKKSPEDDLFAMGNGLNTETLRFAAFIEFISKPNLDLQS